MTVVSGLCDDKKMCENIGFCVLKVKYSFGQQFSKCGLSASDTFKVNHEVKTIFIVIQRSFYLFDCVDIRTNGVKAIVGQTTGAVK